MNKIITLYELLGLVKDGKAPRKVKGRLGKIYTYHNYCKDYIDDEGKLLFANLCQLIDKCLDDEIEILDEEEIIIKNEQTSNGLFHDYLYYENSKYQISVPQKVLFDELDKIKQEINKLKKEGKYNG